MWQKQAGFPGGSDGKESTCNAGDLGLIPGSGRSPGGGRSNPLQYSYLENPHGQRKLVGYGPRGRRELDTTKRLNTMCHTVVAALRRDLDFPVCNSLCAPSRHFNLQPSIP